MILLRHFLSPLPHRQLERRSLTTSTLRLAKRMGELDLCSRREADRWIRQGLVQVDGKQAVIGEQVPADLPASRIVILRDDVAAIEAVVLHKPMGYVSGQAEHGHPPAVRLLTPERMHAKARDVPFSWKGFAPAGRLDLNSTGLLLMTSSGLLAKKIISGTLEKEYRVRVEPAQQPTRRELQIRHDFVLPPPSKDFAPLTEGGHFLLGDHRPLLPCRAEWTSRNHNNMELCLILREGRKHQIRRALRQLAGYHVVDLHRTRIGPIQLGDLPEGSWRPLTDEEREALVLS